MNLPKLSYFSKLTTSWDAMLMDMQLFLDTDPGIYQDPIYFYPGKLIELLSEVETELILMDKNQIQRAMLQLNRSIVTMKEWLVKYQKQYKSTDENKVYAKAKEGKIKNKLNVYHFYVLSRALPTLEARIGEMTTEAGIVIPTPEEQPAKIPKDQPPSEYLTTKEVAAILKVTTRTIQNWRNKGEIKFDRIDRNIRYKYSDVMAKFNSEQEEHDD